MSDDPDFEYLIVPPSSGRVSTLPARKKGGLKIKRSAARAVP
jgi:hypothetical protein